MTSATLSAGGRRASAISRIGSACATARRCCWAARSTIATRPNCTCSARMPDPSADPAGYEEAVLAKIPEYVERTQGRAFVLFTSYQMMQRAAAQLRAWLQEHGLSAAQPERRPAADADGRAISRRGQRGAVRRG